MTRLGGQLLHHDRSPIRELARHDQRESAKTWSTLENIMLSIVGVWVVSEYG